MALSQILKNKTGVNLEEIRSNIEQHEKDYEGYILEIDSLKEAYTTVTQKDIFKINPFRVKSDANGVATLVVNDIFMRVCLVSSDDALPKIYKLKLL